MTCQHRLKFIRVKKFTKNVINLKLFQDRIKLRGLSLISPGVKNLKLICIKSDLNRDYEHTFATSQHYLDFAVDKRHRLGYSFSVYHYVFASRKLHSYSVAPVRCRVSGLFISKNKSSIFIIILLVLIMSL